MRRPKTWIVASTRQAPTSYVYGTPPVRRDTPAPSSRNSRTASLEWSTRLFDHLLISKHHAFKAPQRPTIDGKEHGISDHLPVDLEVRLWPVVTQREKRGIQVDREKLRDPTVAKKIRNDPRWEKLVHKALRLRSDATSVEDKERARAKVD